MTTDLDEFLNSIGIPTHSVPAEPFDTNTAIPSTSDGETVILTIERSPQEESQPLTQNDWDNLLDQLDDDSSDFQEAEEVIEEEEDRFTEQSMSYHPEGTENIGFREIIPENPEHQESQENPENQENLSPLANPEEAPLLPENSPTLLINDATSRFSGAEWFEEIKKKDVILAGLGGIGSWTAFQLAKMDLHKLMLYDDDIVEEVNQSGQFYATADIGRRKGSAIAETIYRYNAAQNTLVNSVNERFTNASEAGDIMICGFDSMGARRTFFESWITYLTANPRKDRKKCLFMDGRLSMDTLQVFCIQGNDDDNIKRYRNECLFSDAEADETVCSRKQTTYLACMIGSFIVNLFTNWVANSLDPVIPYDVPFFTEYDAQNMLFKTER